MSTCTHTLTHTHMHTHACTVTQCPHGAQQALGVCLHQKLECAKRSHTHTVALLCRPEDKAREQSLFSSVADGGFTQAQMDIRVAP